MSRADELRWWSRAALAEAGAAIGSAWRRWCEGWDAPPPGCLTAVNAFEALPPPAETCWFRCTAAPASAAWLGAAHARPVDAVQALLFGALPTPAPTRSAPSLADEVAHAAWRSWCGALASLVGGPAGDPDAPPPSGDGEVRIDDDAGPPAGDRRAWSGAIRVHVEHAAAAGPFAIHLSPQAASALLRPRPVAGKATDGRPPITAAALAEGIGCCRLRLRAELDGVSLDLRTLRSLQAGDVVPLPHRLDAPLRIRIAGRLPDAPAAPPLCAAFLGASRGRRAVELVRSTVAS